MSQYPPIINILSKSVRNIGKSIVRDYSEIEKLQNSLKPQLNFVQRTNSKINANLSSALTKLKKESSILDLNSKHNSNCWILESIDSVKNELGLKKIYKLASNENPNGPSKKALNAIKNSLESIHRYPDPSGLELRGKLAQKFNLNIDNIVFNILCHNVFDRYLWLNV